ncbi:MAG: hypothetical protein AAGD25_17665 [Cyanobacteria bacterium P01_F01_bin.150]
MLSFAIAFWFWRGAIATQRSQGSHMILSIEQQTLAEPWDLASTGDRF